MLLVATISSRTASAVALVAFALATATAMALISAGLGRGLARDISRRRLRAFTATFGVVGPLYGVWYALAAANLLPYLG